MEGMPVTTWVGILGFVLGFAFGVVALKTNFCTMGAISDMVLMGDWNRFRAWTLAIAVAIIGSQGLHMAGFVDLDASIYLTPNIGWAGAIVGGLLFGFGMTMAGGCGNKTLVRLGAGNLKSLIVAIVLGIFAYMTLRGLTGLARVELEALTDVSIEGSGLAAQGIPDFVAGATGLAIEPARMAVTAVAAGLLLWFSLKSGDFRRSKANLTAGIVIGLLVTAGWYATGVLGKDEFDPTPLASFTFVNPLGNSLQYLMTFTGSTINFGIATVGGVIAGSFVAAKATGEFRIESFTDAGDMSRHIIGAALMGIGGIMAMGCTIGQGLTGMSTLALTSLIAWIAIIAGGVYGIKYLEEGSLGGALQAMFARG